MQSLIWEGLRFSFPWFDGLGFRFARAGNARSIRCAQCAVLARRRASEGATSFLEGLCTDEKAGDTGVGAGLGARSQRAFCLTRRNRNWGVKERKGRGRWRRSA